MPPPLSEEVVAQALAQYVDSLPRQRPSEAAWLRLIDHRAVQVITNGLNHTTYELLIDAERAAASLVLPGSDVHWTFNANTQAVFARARALTRPTDYTPTHVGGLHRVSSSLPVVRTLVRAVVGSRSAPASPPPPLSATPAALWEYWRSLAIQDRLLVTWHLSFDAHGPYTKVRIPGNAHRHESETNFVAGSMAGHRDTDFFLHDMVGGSETQRSAIAVLRHTPVITVLDERNFFALTLADSSACDKILPGADDDRGPGRTRCPTCFRTLVLLQGPDGRDRAFTRARQSGLRGGLKIGRPPPVSPASREIYTDEQLQVLAVVPDLSHVVGHVARDLCPDDLWPRLSAALRATNSGKWAISLGTSISIRGFEQELLGVIDPILPEPARRLIRRLHKLYSSSSETTTDAELDRVIAKWWRLFDDIHVHITVTLRTPDALTRATHRLCHVIEAAAVFRLPPGKLRCPSAERIHSKMNTNLSAEQGEGLRAVARTNGPLLLIDGGLCEVAGQTGMITSRRPRPQEGVIGAAAVEMYRRTGLGRSRGGRAGAGDDDRTGAGAAAASDGGAASAARPRRKRPRLADVE